MCLQLPWVEVGEGLTCIIHNVSPSTLGGGGGGAHLHNPQCVPLPWVEVGEGLICIIHNVSPTTLGGGGGSDSFTSPTMCLPRPCMEGGSCTISPLEDAKESHPHLHLEGVTHVDDINESLPFLPSK